MLSLKGRSVTLREIERLDLETLWSWRNNPKFMSLCSTRRNDVSCEEFEQELVRDFTRDRFLQCMIVKDDKPIGTVFGYNLNQTDGFAFFTVFIEETEEHSGVGAEGCALFMNHLFVHFNLFKIYAEVYSYNEHSLSCLFNAGFVEEGRFRGHRLVNGERFDLIRLSFFRSNLARLERFIRRLLGSSLQ